MGQEVLRPVGIAAVALALAGRPNLGHEQLAEILDVSLSTAHQAVQRLKAAGLERRTPEVYEALALVDAVRVGRARERNLALEYLSSLSSTSGRGSSTRTKRGDLEPGAADSDRS